jgi:hypothetical protein
MNGNRGKREGAWPNDSGQVLVAVALLSVVLVGFLGVALDGGYMYLLRRRAQTAADAGAYAGTLEIWQNRLTNITAAARTDSGINGYTHGTGGTVVDVYNPPISGPWTGNAKFVEVVITQPYDPFFMQVLGFGSSPVRARAVGGVVGVGMGCIHALDPHGGASLMVTGGATVNATDCGVIVNSDDPRAIHNTGGGCINAGSVDVTGGVHTGSCISPTPNTGAPPQPDPLAGLPRPPITGCDYTNWSHNSGSITLTPPAGGTLTFCGGMSISGGTVNFGPGLYILNGGGMSVSSTAQVTGTGVTFYNTQAQAGEPWGGNYGNYNFTGQTWGYLKAPTNPLDPWSGLLMIQDPTLPTSVVQSGGDSFFAGGSDMVLEGIIYMPDSLITWSGGSNSATYSSVIAYNIKFTGNSTFNSDWSAFGSGGPLFKPKLVE